MNNENNKRYQSILFDLDGTLIDTAADMIGALNSLLLKHQRDPVQFVNARPYVSHGSRALVELGFEDFTEPRKIHLIQDFLLTYEENIAHKTQIFSGLQQWIQGLEKRNVRWGIVTNKPEYLTHKLLNQLQLPLNPGCVIAGDSLLKRKPHPMPLMHAAALLRTPSDQCIFVGDARADIAAGHAAGMYTIAATYGYIIPSDNPINWNAGAYAQSVEELIDHAENLLTHHHID